MQALSRVSCSGFKLCVSLHCCLCGVICGAELTYWYFFFLSFFSDFIVGGRVVR